MLPHRGHVKSQVEFALAHPVFDPERQIVPGHFWRVEWRPNWSITAGLTVDIGQE
jgi:hypothetical protein